MGWPRCSGCSTRPSKRCPERRVQLPDAHSRVAQLRAERAAITLGGTGLMVQVASIPVEVPRTVIEHAGTTGLRARSTEKTGIPLAEICSTCPPVMYAVAARVRPPTSTSSCPLGPTVTLWRAAPHKSGARTATLAIPLALDGVLHLPF